MVFAFPPLATTTSRQAPFTRMKIHEYQAKDVLKRFKVPVPDGRVATTPEEAATAYQALQCELCVVKAQIHAGGRGKAGGG
jgi:succinyl-CoA synthetase beta subunit